jgi:aryl carrier-like protein
MTSFRKAGDKDWDYVRLSQDLQPYVAFEMRSEGIYELIALEGLPSKVASNRSDGSYATKDLFTPHPTTPNAWKYYARMDDTLVLLNGEKHVPTSFEQMIRDNINVAEAVLFGSSKPRIGMMLIPSASTTGMTEEQVLQLVTPIINQANEDAPGYAKLALDMVKVLPVGTPYPKTDKGTVIRAAFYKQFATEIDAIYERGDASSGDLALPEEELREFIQAEIAQLLALKDPTVLDVDTDFFSLGVDSLQAIQLRAILAKRIDTGGQKMGSNIAFDFPTLRTLARKLYCMRTGETSEAVSVEDQMATLINKYGVFEKHVPMLNEREGQYVVSHLQAYNTYVVRILTSDIVCDRCHRIVRSSRCCAARRARQRQKSVLPCSGFLQLQRQHASHSLIENSLGVPQFTIGRACKNYCSTVEFRRSQTRP